MKIFITGSTQGLGLIAGEMLLKNGHHVIFHARNQKSILKAGYEYLLGDLNKREEVLAMANSLNRLGAFDVIIHNAGVYNTSPRELFMVNVLAPFLLSSNIPIPKRMVFLSSGLHLTGKMNLDINKCTYSDTKLCDLILTKYYARKYPDLYSNAVCPGWVPTRMGGMGAPDDLVMGAETQVWLAESNDQKALVSGRYFHHKEEAHHNSLADLIDHQERLIDFLNNFN